MDTLSSEREWKRRFYYAHAVMGMRYYDLWGRYRGLTGSYSDKEFMKNKSRPTVI